MTQEERSERIKAAIEMLGGPTKAANTLGVSNGTIHSWIKAGRIHDIDQARFVADKTGVDVTILRESVRTKKSGLLKKGPNRKKSLRNDIDAFQAAMAPLIEEWQSEFIPFPEPSSYMGRMCYEGIDFAQVVQAVAVMAACLNFGGASGLYEMVATLVMDEPMRDKIEALLAEEKKKGWTQIHYGCPPRKNPGRAS